MSHLLAFHIGPVQDFIATARRTQDWWMGSWLLAYLSRHAIETARGKGAVLVLPRELTPPIDSAIADTPNHFFARFADERAVAAAKAKEIEAAVKGEWFCIHRKVKGAFFANVPDDLWARQLENFLEIYWAVILDDSEDARNRAQAALDARKRLRNFIAIEEPHLKCTLCGARQEVSGKTSVGEARDWWIDLVSKYRDRPHHKKLRIRENGNERLCAVCTVKRAVLAAGAVSLDVTDGHFPSTSSVAAAMFMKHMLETDRAKEELDAHFKAIRQLHIPAKVDLDCLPSLKELYEKELPQSGRDKMPTRDKEQTFDGDLFYTETFTEKRIKEEFPEAFERIAAEFNYTEDQLRAEDPHYFAQMIGDATATLRAVYRAAEARPSKYFAALMMDGDHMGTFYGKMAEQEAQAMSGAMSQFAREQAKSVVEEHFGRLVYAGGDDTLALLPLEEALPCARELRVGFNKAVEAGLKGVDRPDDVKPPTPSIGIAIAHHTAPLDGILLAMQRAEKAAKGDYGRDALCIHVLKRSGEEVHVGTHWQYGDLDAMDLANRVVAAFSNETLTMKFAHAVAGEARGLAGVEGDKFPLPREARAAALKRLAKRHCAKGKEKEAESLAAELAAWAEGKNEGDKKPLGIEEIAQWVLLARFIASGGRDEE
jgi:CRISPR-associated protein Cmr2